MKKHFLALGALAMSTLPAMATVQADITTAVGEAKTAGEAVLGVAATIIAGFLIFKLAKRAANRA